MTITDELTQANATDAETPAQTTPIESEGGTPPRRRQMRRPMLVLAAAAAAITAGAATAAVLASDDGSSPAFRSRDEIVRDLVDRGVVPGAALDDGTQIVSPNHRPAAGPESGAVRVRASNSRDDRVRSLVERGVVPGATLDDGTQIISPYHRS